MGRAKWFPAATFLLVGACAATGEEAADAFNSLYGQELNRVAATPSPADDVALARQMLSAAREADKQPGLQSLLCEKACELGAKDLSGHPTALAAVDLLAEKAPARKAECLQKTVALYQREYAAAPRGAAKAKAGEALIQALSQSADAHLSAGEADAAAASLRQALAIATATVSDTKATLQGQLIAAIARQQVEKQLALLKAKLTANPKDDAARKEIVRIYVVELDNPAEAAKFIDESLDEATRKFVPAAARPLQETPELACMELGGWYYGLADQGAAPASKAAMLRRSVDYYERFLVFHKDEDLPRTTAALNLKKAADALARLGPAVQRPVSTAWTDGLKLLEAAKNLSPYQWEFKNGRLLGDGMGKPARIMIPINPKNGYEMEVTFVRTGGDGGVRIVLPVSATTCSLVLCWRNQKNGGGCGLELVSQKAAAENETAVKPGTLVTGQEYTVGIKVAPAEDNAEITVRMNGQPYLKWRGPQPALSPGTDGLLTDPHAPGLGVGGCTAEFRAVRMRALPGGELKTPPPAAAGETKPVKPKP